jgi:predicted Zn-dependent peptidase
VRAFYREHYTAGHAAVVVVGDITLADAKARLDRAFTGWSSTAGAAPTAAPIPTAPQLTRREVVIIDKPGAAQSQIRIGWVGVPRSTGEYAVLQVLNTILGGSFTSRLNQNLRERNGYTYGASSGFDMRTSAGPYPRRRRRADRQNGRGAARVLCRARRNQKTRARRRA